MPGVSPLSRVVPQRRRRPSPHSAAQSAPQPAPLAGPAGGTERGAAAVELALVLPLLLLVLFGIFTYGMMLSFRQGLSQAADEGARAAAVAISDSVRRSNAQDAINAALDPYGVTCDLGTQKLSHDGAAAGACSLVEGTATCASCVEVTLDYSYDANPVYPVLPFTGIVVPDSMGVESQVRYQ
ncbi:TadE/TadG family type IV pilus assembly protein [Nocardioides sp. GY 10127]|uniref:TadE/TadG family type IV pilus assembly protein n=1 Tax=Nocardioides sp. GY 10127 TaxID=2569762 RepID=UPI0010A8FE2B|nr:TadE/TadG family type IV pilus assembly protein [Nocardioides sp. GY 10127]TIC80850.1 hypothetical protein E8D37_13450 [Nocardioides sp. GY 10127]